MTAPVDRHRLVRTAGMTEGKLASIGAIAILSAHTEHYVEKAIWAIEGRLRDKKGKVWTDAKQITELIDKLEELSKTVTKPGLAEIIKAWVEAARFGFSCRNSLMHGRTWVFPGDEWAVFARNEPIAGEDRKRPASEFHASDRTLGLLEETFGHLLNGIHLIMTAADLKVPLGDPKIPIRYLQSARSTLMELDDLAGAFNNEKY